MADEKRCVDTIRVLAADVVEKGKSGHPGAPIGCAPMAHTLWGKIMSYDAKDPTWSNRDRFVLSNGHACALLYCMLHLTGYEDMTMDQLKQFRQLGSITAGHPENPLVAGAEVSTGPLGQGISHAVGLAIASEQAGAHFNQEGHTLIDNFTYVICGDGCLQEGISGEASSLAGHLGLGKLIVLYDDNKITIDGDTAKSFTEDVLKRYEAYGWHTSVVEDGNFDLAGLEAAVNDAKAVTDRPSIIKVSTVIGLGSSKQNTGSVHGAPLGTDDLANFKTHYEFNPEESFVVPDDVRAYYEEAAGRGAAAHEEWKAKLAAYKEAFPELAAEFERREAGELPEGWADKLPRYTPDDPKKATRQWSQTTLQAIVDTIPEVVGGSADLQPSNGTKLNDYPVFNKDDRAGRYLHFGVREHAMAAICNGLAAYGLNYVPFGATFLNFIQYALGSVRVCAISEFRVMWIMTHDSIGLGEDGPTHQPVECNILIRAMPNILFMRPGDGNEVTGAYIAALSNKTRSTVMALSRQGMPNLPGTAPEHVLLGGYAVVAVEDPQLVLVGTGSELQYCYEAAQQLEDLRVQVVSMPCIELFYEQSAEHQASVLPAGVPSLSVEAMSSAGWDKLTHAHIAVDTFGLSGPGPEVLKHFGFTTENVVAKSRALVESFKDTPVPDLQFLRSL